MHRSLILSGMFHDNPLPYDVIASSTCYVIVVKKHLIWHASNDVWEVRKCLIN